MNAPLLFAKSGEVGPRIRAGMAIGVSFRDGDGFETREKMGYVCATVKFAGAGNIRIIGKADVTACASRPEGKAQASRFAGEARG
jgi:hypothetical protein